MVALISSLFSGFIWFSEAQQDPEFVTQQNLNVYKFDVIGAFNCRSYVNTYVTKWAYFINNYQ